MTQPTSRLVRLGTGSAGVSLVLLCIIADPAAARQDPGPVISRADISPVDTFSRSLARVGTQYVIGDDLTGNGVPAPGWIRELS